MTDRRREVLEKLWNTCIAHQKKWGNYKFHSAKGQHAEHHERKVIDQALAALDKYTLTEDEIYNDLANCDSAFAVLNCSNVNQAVAVLKEMAQGIVKARDKKRGE